MTAGLSAREHDVLPVSEQPGPGHLAVGEAESLAAYSEARPGFCIRGVGSVRLANYAGLVNIGDRMLEVLPKVESNRSSIDECRGIFLRLLRLAESLSVETLENAAHALRGGTLLDVFISAYFDEITMLVRGGLLRRYHVQEQDLPVIRGRMLIGRQIRTHGLRPDRIACRFDEFSADNDWNRVLKTALACVKRQISTIALRRRWVELWPAFEEVEVCLDVRDVFRKLSPDRQVVRYDNAIRWARWIVRALTPAIRLGKDEAPGLLFDTNRMFEIAIARRVAAALPRADCNLTLQTQATGRYLAEIAGSKVVGLRPDLVIAREDRPLAIADTKWKRVDVKNGYLDPHPHDVYQMLAYSTAFRCADVALIYPWHEGLAEVRDTVMEFPDISGFRPRLHVICIDVGVDHLPVVSGSDTVLGRLLKN